MTIFATTLDIGMYGILKNDNARGRGSEPAATAADGRFASAVSFAVVIPMYNECAGAERCVAAVCRQLDEISCSNVLIVVNDGSNDGTGEILRQLLAEYPKLILVDQPGNRGYGAALCSGVKRATATGYDYVLFMDSDLTNHPDDIPAFVVMMQQGWDLIKASRFSSGGGMRGVPLKRALVSRLGNIVARLLFGMNIRDCTNGFRAVRSELLAAMDLRENGFAVIMEELYHCRFLARRVCEIPVVLTNRDGDQRTTSFSYRPRVLLKYLKYGFLARLGVRPGRRIERMEKGVL